MRQVRLEKWETQGTAKTPVATVLVEDACGCREQRRWIPKSQLAVVEIINGRIPDAQDVYELAGSIVRNCPRHHLNANSPDA